MYSKFQVEQVSTCLGGVPVQRPEEGARVWPICKDEDRVKVLPRTESLTLPKTLPSRNFAGGWL